MSNSKTCKFCGSERLYVKCAKCGAVDNIEDDNTTEKLGHWIKEYLGYNAYRYRCSNCDGVFGSSMIEDFKHNKYCADCGIKMEELKDL